MRDKLVKLQEKIEAIDKYLQETLDPAHPETLYGKSKDSEARKLMDKYAAELLQAADNANPFENTVYDRDLKNKALVQLQVFKLAQDAGNTIVGKVPETNDPYLKQSYDNLIKKNNDAVLKLDLALHGIKKGTPGISSKIDLDEITWINNTSADDIRKSLDSKVFNQMTEQTKDNVAVKNNAYQSMFSYAALMPKTDGTGYTLDVVKSATNGLKDLLSNPKMKEMINAYKEAEEYWLTSAIPDSKEIKYRLNFINTYKEELRSLHAGMCMCDKTNPDILKSFANELQKSGINELYKDYKAIYDPKNYSVDFVDGIMNSAETTFREELAKEGQAQAQEPKQNEKELAEFHKYLYKNVHNKNTGSVRPFVEEFMSLSDSEQLKIMYTMENDFSTQHFTPTESIMAKYKPDMAKIMSKIEAPKWQLWKKALGTNTNWNLLKQCTDKVTGGKIAEDETAHLNYSKKNAIIGQIKTAGKKVLNSLNPKVLFAKAKAAKQAAKEHGKDSIEYLEKKVDVLEQAENATNLTSLGTMGLGSAGSQTMSTTSSYLGLISTSIATGKNAAQLKLAKYKVEKSTNLEKEVYQTKKETSLEGKSKNLFDKLFRNTRISKAINKHKVRQAKLDLTKNSLTLVNKGATILGAGAVAKVGKALVSVGTKVAQNKINQIHGKEVVDESLYESDSDKRVQLAKTKRIISGKYARMNANLKAKYKDQIETITMRTEPLSDKSREEALRNSNELNIDCYKNTIINKVSEDTYEIMKHINEMKTSGKELTEFDKKFMELTDKYIEVSNDGSYNVTKNCKQDVPIPKEAQKTISTEKTMSAQPVMA